MILGHAFKQILLPHPDGLAWRIGLLGGLACLADWLASVGPLILDLAESLGRTALATFLAFSCLRPQGIVFAAWHSPLCLLEPPCGFSMARQFGRGFSLSLPAADDTASVRFLPDRQSAVPVRASPRHSLRSTQRAAKRLSSAPLGRLSFDFSFSR